LRVYRVCAGVEAESSPTSKTRMKVTQTRVFA
jgi:hypothetical protein